jgi:hypothetical protein
MAAVDMKERLRQLGPAPPTLDFLIADLHAGLLPDLGPPEAAAQAMPSATKVFPSPRGP